MYELLIKFYFIRFDFVFNFIWNFESNTNTLENCDSCKQSDS